MPTIHRFFVSPYSLHGTRIILPEEESHHALDVLRLKKGSSVVLFDGEGRECSATIASIKEGLVSCLLQSSIVNRQSSMTNSMMDSFPIILAQAVLKREAMDWVIQKAVELGVRTIIPMLTQRTVVRPPENPNRWTRLVMAAGKQSEQPFLTKVEAVSRFQDVVARFQDVVAPSTVGSTGSPQGSGQAGASEKDLKMLSLERSPCTVKRCLQEGKRIYSRAVLLLGPEGGFVPEEVQMAQSLGFQPVSLGSQILRAETAAISLISILKYEFS